MSGLEDMRFAFIATKNGGVRISFDGRVVTVLKGSQAKKFLARVEGADEQGQQLAMAKATGHFKHGNERPVPKG